MPDRERQADFATGDVEDASIANRPDAIQPTTALAFGPNAVGDVTQGLIHRAWAARFDNDAEAVYLQSSSQLLWYPEVELFTYSGDPVDAIALAFDAGGRPVVALERDGDVWIRYWNGSSYTLANLGPGVSPHLIHQAPNSSLWAELYLLYEVGSSIVYREGSEAYATEYDSLSSLGTGQRIERVILDGDDRVHLILSVRDAGDGTYGAMVRLTSTSAPPCIETSFVEDRIDVGNETIFVWRDDFELLVGCELECDILLIGGGLGETIMWATAGGFGQNPDVDTPLLAHRAFPGGAGGTIDLDGSSGGSGGGGGGQSPSGNAMWTAGGQGIAGQGNKGGGGRSTWGLLPTKIAASGGGGGYGGRGGDATLNARGLGGSGGIIPGWGIAGPKGGDGSRRVVSPPLSTTGPVPGGGGACGVLVFDGFLFQPLQRIPFTVGQGGSGIGWPGQGGLAGAVGAGGAVAIRVRVTAAATDAVLSGGTVVTPGDGYRYHVFLASATLTVSTPGLAQVLCVGGAAGGGSGCGGGGGGGQVQIAEINLTAATAAITVGAGGAGGAAGGEGDDGEDSSLDSAVVARGGGGGAGAPTSAAGSRATGGGGHGDEGDPGAGTALRGYPGGAGGGFDLSAGGSALSAGGGGGAGGPGVIGATLETQGGELDEQWDYDAAAYTVNPTEQYVDQTEAGSRGLFLADYAATEGFVQARVLSGHSDAVVGLIARATDPAAPSGDYVYFRRNGNRFELNGSNTTALGLSLATFYPMQLYAADGVQEAGIQTDTAFYRRATASTTFDGVEGQWGVWAAGGTSGIGRRRFDDVMIFRSKWLEVGGVPTGGDVRVIAADDTVVATASEVGGTARVDLSRHGDGATGVSEFVPAEGWASVEVRDSGGGTVAEWLAGGVYPGAEFDVDGSDLEFRLFETGEAIVGLVWIESFTRLTPGPENGDGGVGVLVDDGWELAAAAAGVGEDGYFGAGGGGGAEITTAGIGGQGGAGDGGVDTTPPTAGAANSGGGGGGSGDSSVAGAAGGSGLVIVRTPV